MAQNNDIVISAAANTKEAEASIKQLDAQIKGLTAANPKLQTLGNELNKVGTKTAEATDAMQLGFAAVQGSFTGIITKLGQIGLAMGAVVAAVKMLVNVQDAWNNSLKNAADATASLVKQERARVDAVNNRSKELLDGIKSLNDLAQGGNLSSNGIKTLTAMVEEYQKIWGNVGLEVDKVTGKVSGLDAVSRRLDFSLKARQLTQLNKEVDAALTQKEAADAIYSSYIDNDGNLTNTGVAKMMLDAGMTSSAMAALDKSQYDRLVKAFKAQQLEAKNEAGNRLAQVRAARDQFKNGTTADVINAAIAEGNANKAQKEDAANAAAANLANQTNLANGVNNWNNVFDAKFSQLQSALVMAILNGNNSDVEKAKADLENYAQQQARASLQQMQAKYTDALQKLDEAKKNNDIAAQGELQKLVDSLNSEIQQTISKIKLAPVEVAEATQVIDEAKKLSYSTNGTFDAYGVHGLTVNPIEQQQLEVQKQIARNTENLNVPIVGE